MRKIHVPKKVRERHPYHRPAFLRKVLGAKPKVVKASYHSLKEWRQDRVGYFIIKVFYEKKYFGARFCTNDGVPHYDIVGTDAEAIAQTIVRMQLVSTLQHAAYLGHELYKAQIALQLRCAFVQDSPLDVSKKTRKKESDNLPG